MNSFRNLSIKSKLTTTIMVSSSIALLLSSGALAAYGWMANGQALVRHIDTIAEMIGLNSTAALAFDSAEDAQETLSALRAEKHVVSAWVYDESGSVFASYPEMSADTPKPPNESGHFFTENHLHLFRLIELDEQTIGAVYIKGDLKERQNQLLSFAGIVALTICLSLSATFLIGTALRDQISAPLLDLTGKMRMVSNEKDYQVRALKYSQDEVGELIDGFNDMLEQIQDRDLALLNARDDVEQKADELQMELAERHRIEAQIKGSLEEKEVLLKEIHHRVKNNLQVISSLLDLQASNISDQHTVSMFRDSQNRVNSMGLIHERLYQAEDLARIDFADYLKELTANLRYSYVRDGMEVQIDTVADSIYLDVDTSIPCGLIINELVSNSLKYAFPERKNGLIRIELNKLTDNQLELLVRDNGIGLPEGIDLRKTTSLGLKLVHTLTRQLRGKIDVEGQGGAEFKIRFPLRA